MVVSIYELRDPRDLECKPRYVGITIKTLKQRLWEHCAPFHLKRNCYKNNWIKKLQKLGIRPTIHLIEITDSWENACLLEKYWIKEFKIQGYILTNSTEGGEGNFGNKHSEETKKLIGDIHRGKIVSQETRDKISKFWQNAPEAYKEIRKQKLREISKYKPLPEKFKMGNFYAAQKRRGTFLSESTKRKISESMKGNIISENNKKVLREIKSKKTYVQLINGNEYYFNSSKECYEFLGIAQSTFNRYLNTQEFGKNKNIKILKHV